MSNQRERTYVQEGYISAVQFDDGTVTVKSTQGRVYDKTPVGSSSQSSKTKKGLHSFPEVGDRCWITRDVNGWYVSDFGPKYDPSGKFVTKRPSLFRPGYMGLHADLSGVDILPSTTNELGQKIYANEKLGVSTNTTTASGSGIPVSSTTTTATAVFDSSALIRSVFVCDICSTTTLPNFSLPKPILISSNISAVVINTQTGGNQGLTTITVTARNLVKVAEVLTGSTVVKSVLVTIPGVPQSLITVTAATPGTFDTKGPPLVAGTAGTVTFTLSKDSALLPSGVFDIHIANINGSCFKVRAGLSVSLFTPGNFETNYYDTPPGYYLAPAAGTANIGTAGLLFTMRADVGTAVLQEQDTGTITATNIKYIGQGGSFPDFLVLKDSGNTVQDSSVINSFRQRTISLAQITGASPPVFSAEITGADAVPAANAAIKSRLESGASTAEIFASDNTKRNRGLLLTNLQLTDKFRVRVFSTTPKPVPDYSLSALPRLDGIDPDTIILPQTVYFSIKGENIRVGSVISLVQSKEFVNPGTSDTTLVDVNPARVMSIGTEAVDTPTTITVTNIPANTFSGKSSLYRISDRLIGVKLEVTQIPNNMFGRYNLAITHPSHSPVSITAALTIQKQAAGVAVLPPGATPPKSINNAFLQQVVAVDTTNSNKETSLFTYEVDDKGRLDITSRGGVFFNGQPSFSSTVSSTVGLFKQPTSFVTEDGDGILATTNGNIYIAADRISATDATRGDVHIRAPGCVTVAQGATKAFFGRKAITVQVGTEADTIQVGGASDSITKRFPRAFKNLSFPPGPDTSLTVETSARPYVSVGPLLIPDERHSHNNMSVVTGTNVGLGSTFFALRSRAHIDKTLLEGRLNLVFVPATVHDPGTDTANPLPITGTWHIPLA
jgi:hypothetical protein